MSQTMKTIHTTKRLYNIASPPSKAAKAATSHLRRARANSASASTQPPSSSSSVGSPGPSSPDRRSLHTNAAGYPNPLHYFDSPPPPPPPTSRPGNPHVVSTQRLPSGESQSSHGSSTHGSQQQGGGAGPNPHPQGQQGNGHTQSVVGSTSFTLTVSPSSPAGSSPSDRNFAWNAVRGTFASQNWSSKATDGGTPSGSVQEDQRKQVFRQQEKIFQLDVGAYGIPKRRRNDNYRNARRNQQLSMDVIEEFALGDMDMAVQVGEDAYFVRDDAMGVADGVGGWNSRGNRPSSSSSSNSTPPCNSSHHTDNYDCLHRHPPTQPSPSALFARRLMHFCSLEVEDAHQQLSTTQSTPPEFTTPNPLKRPHAVPTPSLKSGGVVPRDQIYNGNLKANFRNARPFTWPWEVEQSILDQSYPEFALDMDSLLPEMLTPSSNMASSTDMSGIDAMAAALGTPASTASESPARESTMQDDVIKLDPPSVDPVDVLERAYNRTLAAHKRRISRKMEMRRAEEEVLSPERLSENFWNRLGFGLQYFSPSLEDSPFNPSSELKKAPQEYEWEPLLAGSSTALLAVLSGDHLRVAHLGDCSALLVRNEEIVWRSEEMWWKFNYPLQLGPVSPTRPQDARSYDIKVQKDDILILASDGMSDNLWEEDVLDEVRRLVGIHSAGQSSKDGLLSADATAGSTLCRKTLAAMLSEALCSRARMVSERACAVKQGDVFGEISTSRESERGRAAERVAEGDISPKLNSEATFKDEVPFARRAREEGKTFRGGKCDDISVLVAVISPVASISAPATPTN